MIENDRAWVNFYGTVSRRTEQRHPQFALGAWTSYAMKYRQCKRHDLDPRRRDIGQGESLCVVFQREFTRTSSFFAA